MTTAGTPVPLNSNIGAQTETGAKPTNAVRQLVFFTPTTGNTGAVYILRKPQGQTVTAAGNPNFIVAIIGTNTNVSLPTLLTSSCNIDQYVVDADTSGNSVIVTATIG